MQALSNIVATLGLVGALGAQTLGLGGVNDYWITPGGTPGGYSCKPLTVLTPTAIKMNVSNSHGGAFAIVWSTCPCTACLAIPPMGTSACLPAATTICPSSNQFLELNFAAPCTNIIIAGVINASGFASIPASIPPTSPPVTLGTQAVFLTPPLCVVPPFNVIVSQGWNVTFV